MVWSSSNECGQNNLTRLIYVIVTLKVSEDIVRCVKSIYRSKIDKKHLNIYYI